MLTKSTKWYTYRPNPDTGEYEKIVEDFDSLPYDQKADWYRSFCSEEDIERILTIKSAEDLILRLAADSIADNTRQLRSYIFYRQHYRGKWSLANHLHSSCFDYYKKALSKDDFEAVKHIATGVAFTPDYNGYSVVGEMGPMIILSNVLRYFSRFSLLAMVTFDEEVPTEVRLNAMRIAIRVMFQTESLDFEMDPRGIIPESIIERTDNAYFFQTVFQAGHEYSHFLLGHLREEDKKECTFFNVNEDVDDPKRMYEYNVEQKEEFDADLDALSRPQFDEDIYLAYYDSVLMLFATLAVYEGVNEFANPSSGYQDHPSAKARFMNILNNAKRPVEYDNEVFYENRIAAMDSFTKVMIDDFSIHADEYETYGSVYLAEPNTAWRGRELIDRKDY